MTTLAVAGRSSLSIGRRWVAPAAFLLLGLIDIFYFAHYAHPGDATLAFSQPFAKVTVPNLSLPGKQTAYVMGAASIALAVVRAFDIGKVWRRVTIGLVLFFFVIALLCWAYAGSTNTFNVINLFQGTLADSIPLILGALAGCLCERSGVINIAIEGQLLLGAFAGAVFASAFGVLWLGIIAGSVAGGLIGLLLGVFAITYLVDQVILGVVLNVFVSGSPRRLRHRVRGLQWNLHQNLGRRTMTPKLAALLQQYSFTTIADFLRKEKRLERKKLF